MTRRSSRAVARAACVVVLAVFFARPCPAQEFGPDHPQVRALVEGGVAALEAGLPGAANVDELALAGYAVAKSQVCYDEGRIDRDHPVIAAARRAVLQVGPVDANGHTYGLCVKLLFLSALDPVEQRPTIEALLAELLARQKPHGGWGYSASRSGDTSMTQLAVLTLWELERHGFATHDDAWENAIGWLLRTQDPSGGFGYQGREGTAGRLVPQNEVRESLTAGAAGSLYIALDHLHGGSRPDAAPAPPPDDLPPEVREKDPRPPSREPVDIDVDRAALDRAIAGADAWLENTGRFPPQRHLYYYLYALERYRAFRDKAEGREDRDRHVGGPWYDAGVRLLQARAGNPHRGWRGESSASVDTSFAILFLIRSSQLSIDGDPRLAGGELAGRRGLASLVRPDERESELLGILRDPVAGPVKAPKAAKDDSPVVRAAALWALARTRDLDNVPALLFALDDPEWLVAQQAHEGLRFIGRRLASAPLELPEDGQERANAIREWKEWFLSIRPTAELEE